MWCVPTIDDEYLKRMFALTELYAQPYDPRIPVVCVDETPVDLHQDKFDSIITKRQGTLRDYEYKRCGVGNAFVITEPKGGRHYVRITKRKTYKEFAETLRFIASRYPKAITIKLVMDNLSTHTEKSLIKRYGLVEGRRLWARFTVVLTPKHASWLNQAEIAIGVMRRCCLGKRRFPTITKLKEVALPFFRHLRKKSWNIHWKFSTKDAKLWLKTIKSQH